ncbi:hypothetical protein [Nibricoccus sp. IMCC34717]|uniref:hypothetical protein n=1 Tax=Nibricoccus sp. IMCC34717 TaxID=3034021 RepID=UPI00384E368B
MTSRASLPVRSVSRKQVVFLSVAWLLIIAKCVAVSWAVDYWKVPFNAGWLIYPTLAFAVLATLLWLLHREAD